MGDALRTRPDDLAHALGMQLRAVRKAAGMTQAELGDKLGVTEGLLSKMETGARVPVDELFAGWMTECDVHGQILSALECMWWIARTKDDPAAAQMMPWFEIEEQAHTLWYWSPILVPGLAQTRGYAREVFTAWRHSPDTVEDLTNRRLARQKILDRPDGPEVVIVLWEPVLRIPVGSPEDMREQLARLVELSEHPRVYLHVLPTNVGAHMGMSGPITLAATATSELLLIEGFPEAVVTSDQAQVRQASATLNSVRSDARPRGESRAILQEAMEEWDTVAAGGSPATATGQLTANA